MKPFSIAKWHLATLLEMTNGFLCWPNVWPMLECHNTAASLSINWPWQDSIYLYITLMIHPRRSRRDLRYSSEAPTFYKNDLAMRNTNMKKTPHGFYGNNQAHSLSNTSQTAFLFFIMKTASPDSFICLYIKLILY
jgi:hypothetical protein